MQAIILAAGMGRRLGEYTQNNTKCMVQVNGETLISRLLNQLQAKSCIDKIVIVIGYRGDVLKQYIKTLSVSVPIEFVENPDYARTNNIYSLYLAKDFLCKDDTLLFESDLIFEDSVLDILLNDQRPTLALVDKFQSWMDGTCIEISENNKIKRFVARNKFDFSQTDKYYKTVNIYKFSKDFSCRYYVPFLEAYSTALGRNEYYEQVLKVIAMLDNPPISALCLSGQKWYEIDDANDLNIATTLFADTEKQLQLLGNSYGGFWRYPQIKDFCYLVNPYYPPKEMIDEIKASNDVLIRSYPSGQWQNALLAARNFNLHIENVVVGNGAAELIKSALNILKGKKGIIRPTFEEYPARIESEDEVVFVPEDFSYSAKDIMDFFDNKGISTLILINPDNPSGNFIGKEAVLTLCKWAKGKGISIILDESFIDFASGTIESNSLLNTHLLNEYPGLVIIKSISKSYGIPGLRLGILASGNKDLISSMKKDVAIWNINSIAEFYMQIYLKYSSRYMESLELIKKERSRLIESLSEIEGLKVYPSAANYIMIRLPEGQSAHELSLFLLKEYSILIKDLSKKIEETKGQFIRIAVKDENDDNSLIKAMKHYFMLS